MLICISENPLRTITGEIGSGHGKDKKHSLSPSLENISIQGNLEIIMNILKGGLENVSGFLFSAKKCGIKYQNRLDFALIHALSPCNASGLFTTNRIIAAPVRLCRQRIGNRIRSILMNANNANACTGDEGFQHALLLTGEVAREMKTAPESVLMASTGVIGAQLPVKKMKKAIPDLVRELSIENGPLIPQAIMTTDTFPKEFAVRFHASQGTYTIGGIAKGAGMIAPDMATLLSFVITDAPLERDILDTLFKRCVTKTFNHISIDGDMSTNDTALILSPQSEKTLHGTDIETFEESLLTVLSRLSEMIIKDGEGTTKVVQITVRGARSGDDARRAAKAVAESLLVKTAFFGNDPNWGRIACAVGYSGAAVEEKNLSLSFEKLKILERGAPCSYDMDELLDIVKRSRFEITVDIGMGTESCTFLTTDISYEYVKINSEYTS